MQQARKSFRMLWGVVVIVSVMLSGCAGRSGGGGGEPSDPLTEVMAAFNTAVFVLKNERGQSQRTSEATLITCPLGGEATVDGNTTITQTTMTAGNFVFDGGIAFANCDGLSGEVGFGSAGTFEANTVVFDMTLAGMVTNTCVIDFEPLTFSFSVDLATQSLTAGTVNGSMLADCAGATGRCTWENVDVFNEAALRAGCL